MCVAEVSSLMSGTGRTVEAVQHVYQTELARI